MKRWIANYWIWCGLAFGILPYLGIAKPPSVGLNVLSIFFGGLLVIASILPASSTYKKMKDLHKSGHIRDLISYVYSPLWCSFVLIVVKLVGDSLVVSFPPHVPVWLLQGIQLAIWGVFLCGLLRIIILLPYMLMDYQESP